MDLEKIHKKDLGLELPNDYFKNSKMAILEKIKEEEKTAQQTKVIPLYRKKAVIWVASVVAIFLVFIAVYNPFLSEEISADDVLIASLLTDESNVDNLVDDYVNDELLTEDVFLE